MLSKTILIVAVLLSIVGQAWCQTADRVPYVGYIYPGGGQQGTTVRAYVGGQYLNSTKDVHVVGDGVTVKVVKSNFKPLLALQPDQRALLRDRLESVRNARLTEMGLPIPDDNLRGLGSVPSAPRRKLDSSKDATATTKKTAKPAADASKTGNAKKSGNAKAKKADKTNAKDTAKAKNDRMPDHPLLYELEDRSLRELRHIVEVLFGDRQKRQRNRQLAATVLLEITIDPTATPGLREIRLDTALGLTNPVLFHVGNMPDAYEIEPNDEEAYADFPMLKSLPRPDAYKLPITFNGQVFPGDVDRFRFQAQEGQELVIETYARSLTPYLADAVPGWFQATVALYDAEGNELAYADDYRFDPDPVLYFKVPETGEYEIEIHDSIYRGREDFVYRIEIDEQPFITQMYPLGGKIGAKTVAQIGGWNLPKRRLHLNTAQNDEQIRQAQFNRGKWLFNPVTYAVDALAECEDSEKNDTAETAQAVNWPIMINGRIDKAGDTDVYAVTGKAGEKLVLEVFGRRLESPLDSFLRLTDAEGNVLAYNDDHVAMDKFLHKDESGLVTHHADSYLMTELPADGTYYVHIFDIQRQGGPEYGYRLRITPPEPDFALRATPSSVNVLAGRNATLCVHALRKDGFNGDIEVMLKDAPEGFHLDGGRIPAGCEKVCMTLKTPAKAPRKPFELVLQGRAVIDGRTVRHDAVAADQTMQAFLYQHLVPAQAMVVSAQKAPWPAPPFQLVSEQPVQIPLGGQAQVTVKTWKNPVLHELELELRDAPDGMSLQDVIVNSDGLTFSIEADENLMASGYADNLIVEAFREFIPRNQRGQKDAKTQRVSVGVFPAIPVEIVKK